MENVKDNSAAPFPDSIYVTPSRNEKYFMNFANSKFYVVAIVNKNDEILKEPLEVEETIMLVSSDNKEEYKMGGLSAKPLRSMYWFRVVEPHVIGKLQITWTCPSATDIAPLTISIDVLEKKAKKKVEESEDMKITKEKKSKTLPKSPSSREDKTTVASAEKEESVASPPNALAEKYDSGYDWRLQRLPEEDANMCIRGHTLVANLRAALVCALMDDKVTSSSGKVLPAIPVLPNASEIMERALASATEPVKASTAAISKFE